MSTENNNNTNELRPGINAVSIYGILKENKLEIKKGEKDGKSFNYITGSLVLRCGNDVEVEVKQYTKEYSEPKDGSEPKKIGKYETFEKIINGEYPSMAKDKDNPVAISVWGNKNFPPYIKEERYANPERTETLTKTSFNGGNIKVLEGDSIDPAEFQATFELEMFVTKVVNETKVIPDEEPEETGRLIIEGYVPCKGGDIFPIKLVAGEIVDGETTYNVAEDLDDIRDDLIGSTVDFWGDIAFKKIIKEKLKKGIGKPKKETETTYVSELLITGATFVTEEEGGKPYTEEEIKAAVNERKVALDNVLNEAIERDKNGNGNKKKGHGIIGGGSKSSEDKKPARKIDF